MAINATYAGFTNTGHDLTVTLVQADGVTVNIENIMQFDSRQETQDITRVRLDNTVLVADLPKLWTGTIQFDRKDANVDTSVGNIEQTWFSGKDYVLGSIKITISNSQESTTITYFDASVRFEDAGTWKGDDATTCRLAFRAGRRIVG
jgi:hypothetical protein